MLTFEQDESTFRIRHNSYLLALIFLFIPPALLYEHYGNLLDDSLKTGELVGFWIGILLPLVGAYFFTEFASFTFRKHDNIFRWRWRNLFKKKSGEVPLSRIVKVRRDALEESDSAGLQYRYRLVVILDDASIIPLSRSFSGLHDKVLDQIVEELRDFLGHTASIQ